MILNPEDMPQTASGIVPDIIVLGKVVGMYVQDDCVMDPAKYYIDTPKLDLVGRMHGRGWYARTTDRIEIPRIDLDEWEARKKKG